LDGQRIGYTEFEWGDRHTSTNVRNCTVTATVNTPCWTGYANASPAQQQQWDANVSAMKGHEQGHVDIANKGAENIGRAVASQKGKGTGKSTDEAKQKAKADLQQKATKGAKKAEEKVHKQQTDYDKKTGHGEDKSFLKTERPTSATDEQSPNGVRAW